jgi:hypothetical protein
MISNFPLWTFHLFVATFQQHLHMAYISLSWYDIPEIVVLIRISLIEGCCLQVRYCQGCTGRVNLVTNPVISHEWGKDREVFATSRIYLSSFVTHIFRNGEPSQCICPFSFDHYVFCSSSIYGFWLPLWYLQSLHTILWIEGTLWVSDGSCNFQFSVILHTW